MGLAGVGWRDGIKMQTIVTEEKFTKLKFKKRILITEEKNNKTPYSLLVRNFFVPLCG